MGGPIRCPSVPSHSRDRIDRTARDVLGFDALRPGQREAIESVLAGRDTLAVLSTGSGKSAIYQIAGLLTKGPTVVVSPLIALQRDQVDALHHRALGAAQLNSSVPQGERAQALAELAEDALEFLFLAPEQLANSAVLEQSLREALARGEAHIGVEHLLLALLREDVGGAARTLHELGIDADVVRARLGPGKSGGGPA